MYMSSPHPCGKVSYNVCIKVYFCGKVCDLNVIRSCDLSEQSITTAQKCQGGADKNSHTEPRKNMRLSYKY